jgi:hypothetical protein
VKVARVFTLVLTAALALLCLPASVWAAPPPVRLALVPGNASGMEQEVVDRITSALQGNSNIKLSTVNPDWFGVVNIIDKIDSIALTIRVNGTLTIKTRDGHVIDTVSVQSNKQDFNLSPGTPAPLNKGLVNQAVEEVIGKLSERAIDPINDAIAVEMETRGKIIQANQLGDQDKYAEALDILKTIGQDTPHFKGARELMHEFQMEQDALDLMNQAKADARAGRYSQAIVRLKAINKASKRYQPARQMIAQLSARSVHRTARGSGSPAGDELKALEAQKQALDAQKKAIDAQETAIKLKSKSAR